MSAATLAAALTRLADAADRGSAAAVAVALQDALALSATTADLPQRLTVWRDVWPRLGQDPQFRAAVAREARRWAEQCAG